MSQAAALALSIVCAATITTGGILWSESRRAEPAPADPNAGEARAALERVEERLGSLEKRLASLEQRPAAPAQGEIQRSEASLSRREIEALVAEAVARSAVAGQAGDAGAGAGAEAFVPDSAFRQLLVAEGDNSRTAIWAAARKAGKHEELLALFEAAAKSAPNDATAQFEFGRACLHSLMTSQDMLEQGALSARADKAFDVALEIDERHWEARFSKAVSYTFYPDFLGKKKEAISHLQILIDQQEAGRPEPKHIETYLTLGNVYAQQGKDADARQVWERGLGRFPEDARLKERLQR